MYNATTAFKTAVDDAGRITNVQIEYPGPIIISSGDIIKSFSYVDSLFSENESSYIGSFVGKKIKYSIYTQYAGLMFDSLNKTVICRQGLFVSGAYEYIPMGSYIVSSEAKDIKSDSAELEAIDFSIKFDKEFVTVYTPGMTIYDWVNAICVAVGVQLGSTSWFNSTQVLAQQPTIEGTYRDAIKHAAAATLTFAKIGRDDKLYFKKFVSATSQLANIFEYTTENTYGPINQLVFGKGSTNDNVAVKDDVSIAANGLTEILIDNNEIINYLDRETLISTYFTALSGLTYNITSINYPGNPCFDTGDIITFLDDNDVVQTIYIFDISLDQTGSWYGILKATAMSKTDTNTDYKGSYDKRVSKTEINVDKVKQEITLITSDVSALSDKTNGVVANDAGITLTPTAIISAVMNSTTYTTDKSLLATKVELTQTAEAFKIAAENQIRDEYGETISNIETNFVFDINGLKIGKSGSAFSTKIDNNEMGFYDGTTKTAYVSGGEFLINKGTVISSLTIGVHKIEKYSSGITIFRFVG